MESHEFVTSKKLCGYLCFCVSRELFGRMPTVTYTKCTVLCGFRCHVTCTWDRNCTYQSQKKEYKRSSKTWKECLIIESKFVPSISTEVFENARDAQEKLQEHKFSSSTSTRQLLGFTSCYDLGSGTENREYGRRDPLRWPCDSLYPQNLALTSPTSGGRSIGIVRPWTKVTEFVTIFIGSPTHLLPPQVRYLKI
jgi:hypothetical protein